MDAKFMRSLRIGYWPLSEDLKSAGDRRRVVFWANARGHTLVRDLSQKVDVIIASENSDEEQHMYPVVLSTKASAEIYEERDRIN